MGGVISFISVKGGVGKTTLAIETAYALQNVLKKKILLIDANFSAPNIGLHLDVKSDLGLHNVLSGEEGLHASIYESCGMDVVPASLDSEKEIDSNRLKKVIEKYRTRYDFIVIDSSPNRHEMLPVVMASDQIFVVSTPDKVTLYTSVKAAKIAKKNGANIGGIIVNRIQGSEYELLLEEIEGISDLPVLAMIREDKKMIESKFFSVPMGSYNKKSKVSKEIIKLARSISGVVEKKSLWDKLGISRVFKKERVNRELYRKSFYESQFN